MIVFALAAAAGASGVLAQTQGAASSAVLARAKLAEAIAGVKQQWKSDAVLIQVSNSYVSADGKADMWDYAFWSSSARGCVIANVVANGQAAARPSGGSECEAPELKTFMDSDKVLAIARTNGVKAARMTMAVSISTIKGVRQAVWVVMDGGGTDSGNVMLDIDATSGAVLSKTSQR
jgi:hypothetical protein